MSPSTQEQKDKMSAGIMSSLFGSVQRAGAGSLRAGVGRKDHARLSDQRCVLGSVFCCWVALCLALPTLSLADKVDDVVTTQMEDHAIPGLSLAIIQNGKIIKAQGYGFTDKTGKTKVTTSTLFQAGSISKSVAALGALHLVEQSRLSLDDDVNTKLQTWKVPENEFTKEKKVTLRGILSHSAGLTVHGFPGYAVDKPLPTLVQVLNGEAPANTAAIRTDIIPGSKLRYSGGGYTVMQQMIIDVTGKPFPQFMHEAVLKPLGMTNSTYEQPLSEELAASTASGYYPKGKAVKGRWHIYPEIAAAGLWTTASDLGRFAIGIQRSLAGESTPVLSQSMTRQMLTRHKDNDGLGVFLSGEGKRLRFFHNGRDEGFDATMTAFAETGQGAVLMINANNNSGSVNRIIEAIAQEYHWPDHP
jgi:CubicO group peptidase (beta-lactamase class C family)